MLGPSGTILVKTTTIAVKANTDVSITTTRALLTTIGRDDITPTGRTKSETVNGAQIENCGRSEDGNGGHHASGRRIVMDSDLDVTVSANSNVSVQIAGNMDLQAQATLHLQGSSITQN